MATAKFKKVSVLPTTYEANTLYAVPVGTNSFDLWFSSSNGSTIRKLDQSEDILAHVVVITTVLPNPSTSIQPFWWDPSKGTLFIKYTNGGTPTWVEAMPSAVVPQFAGVGTAETVSRSDHWHTYIVIEATW